MVEVHAIMERKNRFVEIIENSRRIMNTLYQNFVETQQVQEMEFAVIPITNHHKLRKMLFGSYEGLPFSHRTSRTNHGNPIPPLKTVYLDYPQQEIK